MTDQIAKAGKVAAAALGITVVTQVLYMALEASATPLAILLWQTEALAFLALALAGGTMLAGRPLIGAAIAAGGLLNVMQIGMGLTMFDTLAAGGEALDVVFEAVLGQAFFLYFAGKAALAVAAIACGWALWQSAGGPMRWLGLAGAVSGLAALAANGAGMALGMALVFPAGATGTLAAALLGAMLGSGHRRA